MMLKKAFLKLNGVNLVINKVLVYKVLHLLKKQSQVAFFVITNTKVKLINNWEKRKRNVKNCKIQFKSIGFIVVGSPKTQVQFTKSLKVYAL